MAEGREDDYQLDLLLTEWGPGKLIAYFRGAGRDGGTRMMGDVNPDPGQRERAPIRDQQRALVSVRHEPRARIRNARIPDEQTRPSLESHR